MQSKTFYEAAILTDTITVLKQYNVAIATFISLYTRQWRIQDFPLGGGANLQRVHFSTKTYAKTKEIDPVGGARAGGAPPPGSANARVQNASLHLFSCLVLYRLITLGEGCNYTTDCRNP